MIWPPGRAARRVGPGPAILGSALWVCTLAPLAVLAGCQDQVETFITIRHGVATVEVRLQNIWRDGLDCTGATQCAAALEAARREHVVELTDRGATVTASGFSFRGQELDSVFRYTVPVGKLDDNQIIPITVQRPVDVRAGRAGVPSIAVLHLAGSPTTVEMKGPTVRISGDMAQLTGVAAVESAVGVQAPDLVVDVLSRGRGRAHVIVPSTDTDGRIQHHEPWIQDEVGLQVLLSQSGTLIDG